MKKTIYLSTVIALLLVMTFALSACGGEKEDPPEKEQPETTTEEAVTTPEATQEGSADLGDLYSGSFAIDGKTFTLPVDIQKFYDLGYSFEKDDTLSDGYASSGRLRHSNGDSFVVSVVNTSGSDKKFSQCQADNVAFYVADCKNFDIEFPGGIHLNDSIEDIRASWGEPTDLFDENKSYFMTYEKELEDYEKIRIEFQFYDKKMKGMEVRI